EEVGSLLGGLPSVVADCLAEWREQLNTVTQPLVHRLRNLDTATYLPGAVLAKVDRMSMRVSLEVRCPLLDRQVGQFAQSLTTADCWNPPQDTKRILKRLAARYLPEAWMTRRKMGFGLPSNVWSHKEILNLANDVLLSPCGEVGQYVDRSAFRLLLQHQARPGCFSIYQVWPLLLLEFWLRHQAARPPSSV
ncbi:MAG TPA: asparagine synthase-related protein, partial [Nitrospira sp.]|nr:asparagine synthase-related protein [Nitrospira sp.]